MWKVVRAVNSQFKTLRISSDAASDSEDRSHRDTQRQITAESLLFTATLAERDWDAAQGIMTLTCAEVDEAKRCLENGEWSRLGRSVTLKQAQSYVREIEIAAHGGLEAMEQHIEQRRESRRKRAVAAAKALMRRVLGRRVVC